MDQTAENFGVYYDAALSAIDHLDSGDAFRALKNLDMILQTLPVEETTDLEFRKDMEVLHRQLRYVAFPDLPQEEVQKILSSEIVSFVMSGIDLEDRLSVRNVFTEYGERNNNRQIMKQAILSNTEVIGGVTLQEWIQTFDQLFDPKTREDRSVLDFLTRHPKFTELSKAEQQILKIILMAYEHWMATPRFDIIDLTYLDQNIDKLQTQSKRSGIYENPVANEALERAEELRDRSSKADENQKQLPNESLPLLKALGKFEKLGGQQVTNSKIVVKGQNDPVRPTIFNWLRAYRDELGVGAHDAVARGQFLFHSLNGKGLSADERDQVGMLLKSLDENMPLTIDAGRQEVVFRGERTEGAFSNSGRTAPEAERPLPIQTAVTPPAGGASAVRGAVLEPNTFQTAVVPLQKRNDRSQIQNSDLRQPTDPKAERPMLANTGNISRAVFDLPHVMEQGTRSREQGAGNREQGTFQTAVAKIESRTADAPPAGGATDIRAQMTRPSAFEQAKAIQQANRESRLSISNLTSETVELGRMDASAKGGQASGTGERSTSRPVAPPRPPIAPTVQSVAPAPRAISFEPAKIDNFSFGAGDQKTFSNSGRTPQTGERPLPTRTEDFRPNFAPRDDMNVSALSFSTNHVMPAEKESINRQQLTDNREQSMERDSNSGRTANKISGTTVQTVPVQKTPIAPTPIIQKPVAPANRYRITPTGHRDEVASDDTPSPHVVDLRG